MNRNNYKGSGFCSRSFFYLTKINCGVSEAGEEIFSMKIHVKICGITRPEDARFAETLGASAVGFVFFRESQRYISPEKAGDISAQLGPFISRVGVFVNEDVDNLNKIVSTAHLTAVQLHGSEDIGYIEQLKGVSVIKAFRVGPDFNASDLGKYQNVNAFLLDTYDKKHYGGTGKSFDWVKAVQCKVYGRVIIAGGLNETNVNEALKCVQPWGIDISSGIEVQPGIKDREKMKELFRILK